MLHDVAQQISATLCKSPQCISAEGKYSVYAKILFAFWDNGDNELVTDTRYLKIIGR